MLDFYFIFVKYLCKSSRAHLILVLMTMQIYTKTSSSGRLRRVRDVDLIVSYSNSISFMLDSIWLFVILKQTNQSPAPLFLSLARRRPSKKNTNRQKASTQKILFSS